MAKNGTKSPWVARTDQTFLAPGPGKVVGPSFSAAEVPEVIEAVINKYLELRAPTGNNQNGRAEHFIETLRRVGHDGFKAAANSVRHSEPAIA